MTTATETGQYARSTAALESELAEFEDSIRSGIAEIPDAVERQIERIVTVLLRAHDSALLSGAQRGGVFADMQAMDADLELAERVFASPDREGGADEALHKLRQAGFSRDYDAGAWGAQGDEYATP